MWILIAVIALLIVVVVAAGLAWLLASGDDTDPDETTTGTAVPTAEATSDPSPGPVETTATGPTEEELLDDAERVVYDYYAAGDAQDCDALLEFMIGVTDTDEWLQQCDFTYNRPGLTYSVEIEEFTVELTSDTAARADVVVLSWGTADGADYCTRSEGWVELWQSRGAGWKVSGGDISDETQLPTDECF